MWPWELLSLSLSWVHFVTSLKRQQHCGYSLIRMSQNALLPKMSGRRVRDGVVLLEDRLLTLGYGNSILPAGVLKAPKVLSGTVMDKLFGI